MSETSPNDQMAALAALAAPEPTFDMTLVGVHHSCPGKSYAKNLENPTPNYPYFNSLKTLAPKTFKDLYEIYSKLLNKPDYTQVLGAPTPLARRLTSVSESAPIRRTGENFAFRDSKGKSLVPDRRYIPLDVDKLPTKLLVSGFENAYHEYAIDREMIQAQSDLITGTLFPELTSPPPTITRLSGSFGTHAKPTFRAHMFIELTAGIPHDDIYLYLSQFDWLDFTTWRNPTQPLFTAAPTVSTPELDKLSPSFYGIPRLYLFNENSSPVPAADIYNFFRPPSEEAVATTSDRVSSSKRTVKATELPGTQGVFNRAASLNTSMSLGAALRRLEYKPHSKGRWIAPGSQTGQAGVIHLEEGYVIDFHDDSPINNLRLNKKQRLHSAYDLWAMIHNSEGSTGTFKRELETLAGLDPTYQQYWQKEIEARCTYIVDGMPVEQVENIVDGLVQDIFFNKMSHSKRKYLFTLISKKVKTLEIKGFTFTVANLETKYTDLRANLNLENFTVHSSNKDTMNVKAFMKEIQISPASHGQGFFIQSYDGTHLELLSEPDLEVRLHNYISEVATDPLEWNYGKLNATKSAIIDTLKASNPAKFATDISHDKFLFQPGNIEDVRSAIDVTDQAISTVTLSQGILNQLPFSEEAYAHAVERYKITPFEKTTFGHFISTSLPDAETREHLRDMMTYLFMPERKAQVVLAFIGVPRSGKSTIKNLLIRLLGHQAAIERLPKQIAEDLSAFHDLNLLTRLIVINEFNAKEITRSQSIGQNVGILKSISGKDSVPVRRMRENLGGLTTDAVPLILSNDLPSIPDPAFQARMRIIKFEKGFPDNEEAAFAHGLIKDLPLILHWILTNPRIQVLDGVPFISLKTPKGKLQLIRDEINLDMDPFGSFCKKYMAPDPEGWICHKDIIYYYSCFFGKNLGRPLPEESTNSPKYGKSDISAAIPCTLKPGKTSKARTMLNGTVPVPRENGLIGIRWINPDVMTTELSEFAEFI